MNSFIIIFIMHEIKQREMLLEGLVEVSKIQPKDVENKLTTEEVEVIKAQAIVEYLKGIV